METQHEKSDGSYGNVNRQDDVDIDQLVEELIQLFEKQGPTRMNGCEREFLWCSFQETTCIYSVAWGLFT